MTNTPFDETISTPMVEALETAWATIRARHTDVPPAVVILRAGRSAHSRHVAIRGGCRFNGATSSSSFSFGVWVFSLSRHSPVRPSTDSR